ncbi:MAG: ROK family protein [Chloroflexi bacterium]|nr:ROK family protein [Chloroflexota bacterium]
MAYRLGVDIGAAKSMLALVAGDRPEIVTYQRMDTDAVLAGPLPPGLAVAKAVQDLLDRSRVEPADVVGIGVGVPGIVERDQNTIVSCPNLEMLNHVTLGSEMAAALGLPVFVNNDANLNTLGEHSAGAGHGVEQMAGVFVSSGIGCGLILNGALYEGGDGVAGEIGHTVIVPEGLACSCGSHGCLEMYCSAKGLSLVAAELFGREQAEAGAMRYSGAQLLIEQAHAGDERAHAAVTQAFTYLGYGLSNLANTTNPHLIVLGGTIPSAWPAGLEIVRRVVEASALWPARRNLRIEASALQNYAGVLGGAALVSQRLH